MYCISCGNKSTNVLDSRISNDGKVIRRRRECQHCQYRFSTFENIGVIDILVEKSWNKKERYNRQKLEDSLILACKKRGISTEQITNIINTFEIQHAGEKTISSKLIWKYILWTLKNIDEVAYIRFASVNLNFSSAKDFVSFIEKELTT